MTKTSKIVVISAGVLITSAILLFIYGQDKRRKQAYQRRVPPEYALRLIKNITNK